MAPTPKTLQQHIRDGTFLPHRHAPLLAGRVPAPFAEYGDRYRAAGSDRERRAVALDFAQAITSPPPTTSSAPGKGALRERRMVLLYWGPDPAGGHRTGHVFPELGDTAFKRLRRDWHRWDREHGLVFRGRRDALTVDDQEQLDRLPESRLAQTMAAMRYDEQDDVPWPPGWGRELDELQEELLAPPKTIDEILDAMPLVQVVPVAGQ